MGLSAEQIEVKPRYLETRGDAFHALRRGEKSLAYAAGVARRAAEMFLEESIFRCLTATAPDSLGCCSSRIPQELVPLNLRCITRDYQTF